MSSFELTVSVVIPTHNRCRSLKRLLDSLGQQTYPFHLMEVIVVANGCTDATTEMLQRYQASYALHYVEQAGMGVAVARNTGADLATGALLIFLDDDIEPSTGMIEAHVRAHNKPNTVVIGYLPVELQTNAGFYRIQFWAWWEEKYLNMRNPGYRYNYEDLLSGNFSLRTTLFRSVNGFDCTLRCREDYELGARLIKHGAEFIFSSEAWGYHRDEVTDLKRSYQRKRQEGKADVQFGRYHPDLIPKLRVSSFKNPHSSLGAVLFFFAFHAPKLGDWIAAGVRHWMNLLEWFRLRKGWHKLNGKLNGYWYLRGIADELPSRKALINYLQQVPPHNSKSYEIELDLKEGLLAAERQLDEKRPESARLKYGDQLIGEIPFEAGAERLRGVHLRPLLATAVSFPFMQGLALDSIVKKQPIEMD